MTPDPLRQCRDALELAASTFVRYHDLHKAKGTEDANRKAQDNAALAVRMSAAIAAADTALAQPAAQPVAWLESPHGAIRANPAFRLVAPQTLSWSLPLYLAHPAPAAPGDAQSVPLTGERIEQLRKQWLGVNSGHLYYHQFARAIEKECRAAPDIDAMVNRFLCWELPKDFCPDGGVTFTREVGTMDGKRDRADMGPGWWPVGTNLLTADQAKAMFLHALGVNP